MDNITKDTLLRLLRAQWQTENSKQARLLREQGKDMEAYKYECCAALVDAPNLGADTLVGLLQSPQGIEYICTHRIPSKEQVKQLGEGYPLPQMGVYIDAGEQWLHNPEPHNGVLIAMGSTCLNVTLSGVKCPVRAVVSLYGATVNIEAKDWAVCRTITDGDSHLTALATDNGAIL